MKNSTRFFLLVAILLAALAVSAYGIALAAPGLNLTSSNLGQSLFKNFSNGALVHSSDAAASASEASHVETQVPETEIPGMQQTEAPVVTETPEASSAAQSGDQQDQNQDNQGEVTGAITALDATSITVDGVVYSLADFSEVRGALQVGDTVKLEFITNPDGTLTVSEVKAASSISGDQQNSSGDSGGHSGGHGDGGSGGGGGDDGGSGD